MEASSARSGEAAGPQAHLARLLPGLDVVGLDEGLGRRAGILLGRSKTSDVLDAAIALLAADGDEILTSDAEDIDHLITVVWSHVAIVPV